MSVVVVDVFEYCTLFKKIVLILGSIFYYIIFFFTIIFI